MYKPDSETPEAGLFYKKFNFNRRSIQAVRIQPKSDYGLFRLMK